MLLHASTVLISEAIAHMRLIIKDIFIHKSSVYLLKFYEVRFYIDLILPSSNLCILDAWTKIYFTNSLRILTMPLKIIN